MTTDTSTIINHILAGYRERVSQCGAKDIGLSDHQFIYCTRKISRIKRGIHKQIKFRSLKYYTVDLFEQEPSKLNFPSYQNYNVINEAIMISFRKLWVLLIRSHLQKRWVKQKLQQWFDGEIADEFKNCD